MKSHANIEYGVRKILGAGALPVVIGGDHSVNIPCINAFDQGGPIHILQIDAHLDFVDERHGVRFMSLGFLVDRGDAVIWRGPMVMKALGHLLDEVAWGELDVLVVDMPPGTGDAHLTLSQRVALSGAVIVTTPQDVALADAIKGVAMFRRVEVPVLGIVENMSYFACPHCGERTDVFGHGGGRAEAERMGVPFLGEVALDPVIRDSGDAGTPVTAAEPDSPRAVAFREIAGRIRESLSRSSRSEPS